MVNSRLLIVRYTITLCCSSEEMTNANSTDTIVNNVSILSENQHIMAKQIEWKEKKCHLFIRIDLPYPSGLIFTLQYNFLV